MAVEMCHLDCSCEHSVSCMNTLSCVVKNVTIRIWYLIPMTGLYKMRFITSTEYKNNVNYNDAINSFGDGGEICHALNTKQSSS